MKINQSYHSFETQPNFSKILLPNNNCTTQFSPQTTSLNFFQNDKSTKRQTLNIKKFRQKNPIQSKQLPIKNYQQFFTRNQLQPFQFGNNLSINNTKHHRLNHKRMNRKKTFIKSQAKSVDCSSFNQNILLCTPQDVSTNLKDYFSSIRAYLMDHKARTEKQKRLKQGLLSKTKLQKQQNNLNIIKLVPYKQNKISQRRHTSIIQQKTVMTQYKSTQNIAKIKNNNQYTSFYRPQSEHYDKRLKKSFQRSVIKHNKNTIRKKNVDKNNIFGIQTPVMSQQQANKLKILYMRDFLWKISYNRGFFYQPKIQNYRFYIGKGNNSRLIRGILNKKGCWCEDSKIENCHFVWTQLKIYDIYKNQKSLKSKLQITNNENISKSQNQFINSKVKDMNSFLLRPDKYKKWQQYAKNINYLEKRPKEDMSHRNIHLQSKTINYKMTNHLQMSRVIGNKKALYRTMQAYFKINKIQQWFIPQTFHITGGLQDQQYLKFLRQFYKKGKQGQNCWIVKPGQLSNRGRNIQFCNNLQQIKDQIKQKKLNQNGSPRTYIVQSYLENPYLYQNRKFDLRHYLMITCTEGQIRGYFYQQGYVRTTSYPYSLTSKQPSVHLTNDAVQKYLPQYGKFQKANKLSYDQLDEYIKSKDPSKGFYTQLFPQIRKIGKTIIQASFPFIDPQRRCNNFEIFGIDIMVDQNYKCWLIQVNTNPCIEVNCPVLSSVIPKMLENAFIIGLDSVFTPPINKIKPLYSNYLVENKFQLIFDEMQNGPQILSKYQNQNIDIGKYGDDDDNYQSCEEDNQF